MNKPQGKESTIPLSLEKVNGRGVNKNWVTRFSEAFRFRKKKRQIMVHPCVINGHHTLVYARGLQVDDLSSYQCIVNFAKKHGYQLKEDQRTDFVEGIKRVKHERRANVITTLVLTASLLSENAWAGNTEESQDINITNSIAQSEIMEDFSLDLDVYTTQEEMVESLLDWINVHSSFTHKLDSIPKIVKVSARGIAEIAFGKELPKAMDPTSLKIYGLYNFKEEAIYLLESLDLNSFEGKAILLHELVHYLQYHHGLDKNIKCKNELESLAYLLEAQYLTVHNHTHNFTEEHINNMSQCRG